MRAINPVGALLLSLGLAALLSCAAPGPGRNSAAPPTTAPEAAEDSPKLLRLARILRAEDRRIADDHLRESLRDPDDEIRARAASALARIGGRGVRSELEAVLQDPSVVVRSEAAFGLGLLGEPEAVAALARVASDSQLEVRLNAIKALGLIRGPEAANQLLRLLDDGDPEVQAEASLALARFDNAAFVAERWLELASSAHPRLRAAVLLGLSGLGSAPTNVVSASEAGIDLATRQRVRDYLMTQAEDPSATARRLVARGLSIPSTPPEQIAMTRLLGDKDRRVRLAAIRAICYRGAPVGRELQSVLEDKDLRVLWTALEGLGRIGGEEVTEMLISWILYAKSAWIRERAVLSLNQANPQFASEVAAGLSRDPDPRIRAAAARAMVDSEDTKSAEIVGRLVRDADPRVRANVVPAIGGMKGMVSKQLARVLDDAEPVVRAAAARAAGRRLVSRVGTAEDTDDAWKVLRRLWDEADEDAVPAVRIAVLDQAARAGDVPRSRALLELGIKDDDRRIRLVAIRHWNGLTGEDRSGAAGPAADLPLEEYVKILRWARRPQTAIFTVQRGQGPTGSFSVRLFPQSAPMTVWNFARLAEQGFYDGQEIQEVIPDLLVGGGDPSGNGTGDPGYAVRDEFDQAFFGEGVLSMRSAGRDRAGSRWFILLTDQVHLEGRYTAFGRVRRNFEGTVARLQPGDRVVSIRVSASDPSP